MNSSESAALIAEMRQLIVLNVTRTNESTYNYNRGVHSAIKTVEHYLAEHAQPAERPTDIKELALCFERLVSAGVLGGSLLIQAVQEKLAAMSAQQQKELAK
jgi:hypothetical protein